MTHSHYQPEPTGRWTLGTAWGWRWRVPGQKQVKDRWQPPVWSRQTQRKKKKCHRGNINITCFATRAKPFVWTVFLLCDDTAKNWKRNKNICVIRGAWDLCVWQRISSAVCAWRIPLMRGFRLPVFDYADHLIGLTRQWQTIKIHIEGLAPIGRVKGSMWLEEWAGTLMGFWHLYSEGGETRGKDSCLWR